MTSSAGFTNGVLQGNMGIYGASFSIVTPFSFTGTTVQISFVGDPGSVVGNAASRINFTDLPTSVSQNITIGTNDITIVRPGNYVLTFANSMSRGATDVNAVVQMVKNGTTVLLASNTTLVAGSTQNEASGVFIDALVVGDTIDFRAVTQQAGIFTFTNFSVCVWQLFNF